MTAPNLVSPTRRIAKVKGMAVLDTVGTLLSNPVNSGQVYKVITLYGSNIHATNGGNLTVDHYRGSTATELTKAKTIANATHAVIIQEEAPLYLEEGDSLRVTADAAATLTVLVSYEVIQ